MAEESSVRMREAWRYERLDWQPFCQSLGQCYVTAEDWNMLIFIKLLSPGPKPLAPNPLVTNPRLNWNKD